MHLTARAIFMKYRNDKNISIKNILLACLLISLSSPWQPIWGVEKTGSDQENLKTTVPVLVNEVQDEQKVGQAKANKLIYFDIIKTNSPNEQNFKNLSNQAIENMKEQKQSYSNTITDEEFNEMVTLLDRGADGRITNAQWASLNNLLSRAQKNMDSENPKLSQADTIYT
jgi:hypothetical protein